METFTLIPRGPFTLASSIGFLEGFTPAAYAGLRDAALELAFPVEGSWETAGVRVRQEDEQVTAGPATRTRWPTTSHGWPWPSGMPTGCPVPPHPSS
jgi:hypothetical protein